MRRKNIFVFLVFVFLLSSVSYSQFITQAYLDDLIKDVVSDPNTFCPSYAPSNTFFGLPDELSFLPLSVVAIFSSFLLSLFLYMIAKVLNHPTASSILSIKSSDLFTVLMILMGFSLIYTILFLPSDSLVRNYHDYAFEFNGKLISKLVSTYPTLFLINSMYYAFYNYQLPLAVGRNNIFGFHLNIGPVFKPLIDVSTTLSTYMGIILGEFLGKQYFLCFIRVSMIPFFFPIGIFLRSFNATKGAGAALIALSIAFFTVYPAMLSLNYAVYNINVLKYDNFGINETMTFKKMNTLLGISTLGGVLFGGYKLFMILRNLSTLGIVFLLKGAATAILSFLSLINMIHIIRLYIELVNIMFVYGFILPAINIFITLNVAREIARVLSIDLDLSAFMRLI